MKCFVSLDFMGLLLLADCGGCLVFLAFRSCASVLHVQVFEITLSYRQIQLLLSFLLVMPE
jgi:hypothetical protein